MPKREEETKNKFKDVPFLCIHWGYKLTDDASAVIDQLKHGFILCPHCGRVIPGEDEDIDIEFKPNRDKK